MSESCFAVSIIHPKLLGHIKHGDFAPKAIELDSGVYGLSIFRLVKVVHTHVEERKMQLAEVEQRSIYVLGADDVFDHLHGNLLASLVVARE